MKPVVQKSTQILKIECFECDEIFATATHTVIEEDTELTFISEITCVGEGCSYFKKGESSNSFEEAATEALTSYLWGELEEGDEDENGWCGDSVEEEASDEDGTGLRATVVEGNPWTEEFPEVWAVKMFIRGPAPDMEQLNLEFVLAQPDIADLVEHLQEIFNTQIEVLQKAKKLRNGLKLIHGGLKASSEKEEEEEKDDE